MNNNIDQIVKNIFQNDSFDNVSLMQLKELVDAYPSFNFAHYMLTRKMNLGIAPEFEEESQRTALYFSNPFWLQWILSQRADQQAETMDATCSLLPSENFIDANQTANSAKAPEMHEPSDVRPPFNRRKQHSELIFESYYTIDYFASQGIKVSQEESPNDKFGRQLKSFTEWLKTMKKLPSQTTESEIDQTRTTLIENFAAHSIEQKEVITETMAEVLIKQGKEERAAELYHKLSLLNPAKSAYFATKIEELKK